MNESWKKAQLNNIKNGETSRFTLIQTIRFSHETKSFFCSISNFILILII